MENEWWYRVADRQVGPVSWDSLRLVAAEGLLRPDDMVWRTGQPDWKRAGTVDGLFPTHTGQPVPPPPPPSHASNFPPEATVAARTDAIAELASPWLRFAGQVIDTAIVYAIIFVAVGFVFLTDSDFDSPFFILPLIPLYLVAAAYVLFADGLPGGQSFGKRILDMKVVKERTGQPAGFMDSFLRNILLALLGPIDWLFIFGQKRQRLGDRAAGTLVLKTVK